MSDIVKAIDSFLLKYDASIEYQKKAKIISDRYFKDFRRPPTSKEMEAEMKKLNKQDNNRFARPMIDPESNPNYETGNGGEIQLKPEHQIDAAEHIIGDRKHKKIRKEEERRARMERHPLWEIAGQIAGGAAGIGLGEAIGGPVGAAIGALAGEHLGEGISEYIRSRIKKEYSDLCKSMYGTEDNLTKEQIDIAMNKAIIQVSVDPDFISKMAKPKEISVGKHHTISAEDAKIMASDKDNWKIRKADGKCDWCGKGGHLVVGRVGYPEQYHPKCLGQFQKYGSSKAPKRLNKSNDSPNIKGVAWDALTPEQRAQLKATRPDLFVKKANDVDGTLDDNEKYARDYNDKHFKPSKEHPTPGATVYPDEKVKKDVDSFGEINGYVGRKPKSGSKSIHTAANRNTPKSVARDDAPLAKAKNHTEAEVYNKPNCDFCGKPAEYDGKTTDGPWGYMCDSCFKEHGSGLGLGKGQKLIHKELINRIDDFINKAELKPWWTQGKYKNMKYPYRGAGDESEMMDAMRSGQPDKGKTK